MIIIYLLSIKGKDYLRMLHGMVKEEPHHFFYKDISHFIFLGVKASVV